MLVCMCAMVDVEVREDPFLESVLFPAWVKGVSMSLLLYSLCSRLASLQSLDCFWYAPSLYHRDAGIKMWVLDILLSYQTCVTSTFAFWTISLPYVFLTSSTVLWRGHLRNHPLTSSCSWIIPDIPKVLHFSHQEFAHCSFSMTIFEEAAI